MKPVLFITGHVPAYRAGALAALHERETIEVALFGGHSLHGGPGAAPAAEAQDSPGTGRERGGKAAPGMDARGFPARHARPHELFALAASGAYRAVVCPTGGRLAPLAGWAGTRRAGLPLLLWASLWAHPRSAAHALSYLPLRRLYRSADAVVTYGPHVSSYVQARGARNVHVAPQSVDNDFWRAPAAEPVSLPGWPERARTRFLFAGRDAPAKGLDVLLDAWRQANAAPAGDVLVLAGGAAHPGRHALAQGVHAVGPLDPESLRNVYAHSDALIVPSVATATFREPWGLVVNEAMNARTAVISSDAVGAAAGGLVRDGVNGLVVPARDSAALAQAIVRLGGQPGLSARLGAAGAQDVLAYSHEAWAEGFSGALASLGVSRGRW
ncbi:MAG TPA: glycosyltransferase family 4 protein [Solirubrobacteraceae bacterium]